MSGSGSNPLEKFPPMDTIEACEKAASRLRDLVQHLQHGEVPLNVLQKTLQYGACVLEAVCMDETRVFQMDTRYVGVVFYTAPKSVEIALRHVVIFSNNA